MFLTVFRIVKSRLSDSRYIGNSSLCVYFVVDCFYIVLFSILEQTHCALVACDSQ